jgi:hypothetical protein
MPQIIADGAVGAEGAAGFDFNSAAAGGIPGNNANCNWIDDDCAQTGGPGGPGVQGGQGGPGGPGAHGGTLDIEVDSFSALISFSAKGGGGGPGGRGGKGQDGGKGGRGGNGDDCEFGRHGGNGGPGGNGGVGGVGGIGGNGGTIIVRARTIADGNQSSMNVAAGTGGQGGAPGTPGQPGQPGDDGSTTGVFSSSSDCPNMGPVPQFGAPGGFPTPATFGNGPNGNPGTGQLVQVH